MQTYLGLYHAPSGPYRAFFDSSNPHKAQRFFEYWERKISRDGFEFKLVEVVAYRASLSFSGL